MDISFIIPLFNCLPLTRACIDSLEPTLPAGMRYEIVLVDDGSTDGTRLWLDTLRPPFRVVLNERNLGYAAANNRGAAIAQGTNLALLNNDLVLRAGWLQPMLELQRLLGDRAGLIGNVQRSVATGEIDHTGIVVNHQGKPVHRRAWPTFLARLQPIQRVTAVTGACVLVRRDLWTQLGGFDEGYMNGGEDIDLCLRAEAAGRINAVALRSVIDHHVSASPGRKRRDEENSYRLARRWRHAFLTGTDHPYRDWCRRYLAEMFVRPRAAEYRLALSALAYVTRLSSTPPESALVGVRENQEREFERWRAMFPEAP